MHKETTGEYTISEVPLSALEELAKIGSSFVATSVFQPVAPISAGQDWQLREEPLNEPFFKDYDAISGNYPLDWAKEFDLGSWGLLLAQSDGISIGSVLLAWHTPGVDLLDGRDDLAVLWDIRVAEDWQAKGVGTALFAASAEWARKRGCSELKIETQSNNPCAVRFYLAKGCRLGRVVYSAYPDLPDEVQLLFYYSL